MQPMTTLWSSQPYQYDWEIPDDITDKKQMKIK